MGKALFTFDYGIEKMKAIEDLGYEVILGNEKNHLYNREGNETKFTDDLKDVEILVCYNPFPSLDISKMENLKWIQLSSIGIDQVPKEVAIKNNITITNNNGGYSIPMAEWIVMSILEMMKNSKKLHDNQSKKIWKMDSSILELYGKTIGFVGTGTIAIESAKRLQPFGVNILGMNTNGRNIEYFNKCYSRTNIDEMLSLCDVVVGIVPGTKETYHIFDKNRFNAMKDGVFFINAARGSIVDEKEMIKNLKNGKIKAAALDVYDVEPLPENHALWDLNNVIISPHNSWISEMRNERRYNLIYENMKRYIHEESLINVVELDKGY